jgi:hypothetical protein
MRWDIQIRWALLSVLLVTGCSRAVKTIDGDELDHPGMKRAKVREQEGDIGGAARIYQALLDQDPTLARAHLALAFLLDRPGGDYVQAIYHYVRYLALRPETEKRAMIEEHVRSATLAMAGTVFSNQTAVLQRIDVLEKENAALRIRNANLDAQLQQSRLALRKVHEQIGASAREATESLERRGMLEAGIQPALPTVKVQSHDTLRKIAARVYGDEKRWRDLYEANRSVLRKPEDVKPGQVLVVPK